MPNRLIHESSPYLRQHAENPVDWFPWGEEAFAKALTEDRPILLSVGYSSCHWCHVMERESFQDPQVAALMNDLFVNIKVDREERPDIDQVYMKAVQAMTGGGGWPMTVFLTPEGAPYYAGTYFPPSPRHGLPSFSQVLRAASHAYRQQHDRVRENAAHLVETLSKIGSHPASEAVGEETLDAAIRALTAQYDPVHGGFGRAPKFPQPVTLELLLRHHVRTGDRSAVDMVVHTLRRMAAGGIRDHLAGGFHRYSVDSRWVVPHFEKMLYDNALLASVYLAAYQVTGAEDLRQVAEHTLDYLLADMRVDGGAFASARDADSEGEEGLYYLWTPQQLADVLSPEDAGLFARVYDVSPEGNFEGRSVLHLPHDLEAVARAEGLTVAELASRLRSAREALLAVRMRRVPPLRDDKVIVSWNALAVRAFAEAGAALGREDYVRVASEAAAFLWRACRREGRLLHLWMGGVGKIDAFLDDHAGLGNALLSLHGVTLEVEWLEAARELCEEILARFWDEASGTVFDTATDAEQLILRPHDAMDNATPSGPSLAAELLARAGHVFDEDRYRDVARRIVQRESAMLVRYGPAFGRMLSVLDRTLAPSVEVAIAGVPHDEGTWALVRAAHERLLRNGTVVGYLGERPPAGVPLLAGRGRSGALATAYVCRQYACRLPVTDADRLRCELAEASGG